MEVRALFYCNVLNDNLGVPYDFENEIIRRYDP